MLLYSILYSSTFYSLVAHMQISVNYIYSNTVLLKTMLFLLENSGRCISHCRRKVNSIIVSSHSDVWELHNFSTS